MKKILFTIIAISAIVNANVTVKQNMKALYKGVILTSTQENYILDNQETMINMIKHAGDDLMKREDTRRSISEKNVIEFTLKPDGTIKDFKYLKRSSQRAYDNKSRTIIDLSVSKLPKPLTSTPLRYIIKYDYGYKAVATKTRSAETSNTEETYQRIPKGTNRFPYSSQEIVRTFDVRKDGYMNITNEMCATVTILTMDNQRIRTGYSWWNINEPIKKGRYKMLIKTKKKCDLYVQYP